MRIHGLTVCVGGEYTEHFKVGLPRWLDGLETLTIVTAPDDPVYSIDANPSGTQCRMVTIVQTDAFYRDGAHFNKGRAMEEGRIRMDWSDWILFFDADIVPPKDWLSTVERVEPAFGYLYGARRWSCPGPQEIDRREGIRCRRDDLCMGFFQLFHSNDPVVFGVSPLLDCGWKHAGGYDNALADRWGFERRRALPLVLAHLGEHDQWCGPGEKGKTAMQALRDSRAKRRPRWDHKASMQGPEWSDERID